MNVCPATLMVPVRDAPLLLLTLNVTSPFPVPDAPAVRETQSTLDLAVQAHEPPAVTPTVPVPPFAATVWLAG